MNIISSELDEEFNIVVFDQYIKVSCDLSVAFSVDRDNKQGYAIVT